MKKVRGKYNKEMLKEQRRIDAENEIMVDLINRSINRVLDYKPPVFSNRNQMVTMKIPQGKKIVVNPRIILRILNAIGDGEYKDNVEELSNVLEKRCQ